MAEAAGALVTVLLQRLRDASGGASSRAFVLARLSDAQRFVNAALRHVKGRAALTIEPRVIVMPIEANLPECVHLEGVRFEGKDLDPCQWRILGMLDGRWFRAVGHKPRIWSIIGRDLMLVYPGGVEQRTVTAMYTKWCDVLDHEDDVLEVPHDDIALVLDLAEAILQLRLRNVPIVNPVLARLSQRFVAKTTS